MGAAQGQPCSREGPDLSVLYTYHVSRNTCVREQGTNNGIKSDEEAATGLEDSERERELQV